MTLKQFKTVKIVAAMCLGAITGWAVLRENYIIPVIALAIVSALFIYLRSKVKEIIADERDYEIGGRAARLSITIFSWIAIFMIFLFMAFQKTNQDYAIVVATLSYSVCLLLIIYSSLYFFHNKLAFLENKIIYIVFIIIFLLILVMGGLRFLSGEDSWMCQDGNWIKHGNPSALMPTAECK
jgi:uncharacterized membrane protein